MLFELCIQIQMNDNSSNYTLPLAANSKLPAVFLWEKITHVTLLGCIKATLYYYFTREIYILPVELAFIGKVVLYLYISWKLCLCKSYKICA